MYIFKTVLTLACFFYIKYYCICFTSKGGTGTRPTNMFTVTHDMLLSNAEYLWAAIEEVTYYSSRHWLCSQCIHI